MHVYTATIGRNYSTDPSMPPSMRGKPMFLTIWEQFIEDVTADMLRAVPSDIVEIHRGEGTWDGVEEESAKITLLRHSKATADMLDDLRRYLSELARQYGQDAIALTIGQSELC